MADFHIVIIGAGPAGLSAAARAEALDKQNGVAQPTYVLLEGFEAVAKTIQRYQKGKKVMAEPGFLDLRSDMRFQEGKREEILGWWSSSISDQGINIRYGTEVVGITGEKGEFSLTLGDNEIITAENVVLGIGLEGNPRTLGVTGDRLPRVEYNLEDPDAFSDETVIVVGAGDSAIENALALAVNNHTIILNRRDEFSRAKQGNLNAILKSISDPSVALDCYYSSSISSVTEVEGDKPLSAVIKTDSGEVTVACDRIIARLGAVPPRRFVESTGIVFPNKRQDAVPELNARYESNVPGIYIVGSLAGYPLIKQAMNQGYDVVEFIHGNFVKPADYPILETKLAPLPYEREVDDLLARFQELIPMFSQLNGLSFRELVIESQLTCSYQEGPLLDDAKARVEQGARATKVVAAGSEIYRPGEFGTSFYIVLDGEVKIEADYEGQVIESKLGRGQFFGESSLLSGRPHSERAVCGMNCVLAEIPRRTMLKMMNSNEEVRAGIDRVFVARALQRHFAPSAALRELLPIADQVETLFFDAGDPLYQQNDIGDCLYIVRSGAVSISRMEHGKNALVAEMRAGKMFGQMALMGDDVRHESAVASVALSVACIKGEAFIALVERSDARIAELQRGVSEQLLNKARMSVQPEAGGVYNYLLDNGLGEATNVLIIDERLCVGCDNCEKACAETHGGISRLVRKQGPTLADIHIPISCRHCEQPHCMKDCPPNALQRTESGEVFVTDTCIGCGNCESNCPYDAIKLSYDAPKKPSLISWLLFGKGGGPGEQANFTADAAAQEKGKKATKCDACMTQPGGPACVRSCPTGAAQRLAPDQFVSLVEGRLQ